MEIRLKVDLLFPMDNFELTSYITGHSLVLKFVGIFEKVS